MKINRLALRSCSTLLSLTLIVGLSSCSNSASTSSVSASEDTIVASSVAEPLRSETHPFVYSDATWSTTPAEIENLPGKSPDTVSFAGNGKKKYTFSNIECNGLNGECYFVFKDALLCKTAYNYISSQAFTEESTSIVVALNDTYGTPTEDKSNVLEDGSGVWLEWTTEDINISYFYYPNIILTKIANMNLFLPMNSPTAKFRPLILLAEMVTSVSASGAMI